MRAAIIGAGPAGLFAEIVLAALRVAALPAAEARTRLSRRTTGRRPAALSDDLEWILAASGRAPADDSRLPLIG
jgi:cation diffusion facilitator CzcD-associated flavoprotein CzcO